MTYEGGEHRAFHNLAGKTSSHLDWRCSKSNSGVGPGAGVCTACATHNVSVFVAQPFADCC